MSFDSKKVVPAFKNLLGFRPYHDTQDIAIPSTLTDSDSGEYYQQKHSAIQLDVIQACLNPGKPLAEYLREVVDDSTNEMLNDLLQYRKLKNYGKTLLEQSVLLNKYGWRQDVITNQNRFVGMQIRVKSLTGMMAVINEIGLQFATPEPALNLYLFHTSKEDPITTFPVAVNGNGSWTWIKKDLELSAFQSGEFHGGAFVLGYYQEDVTGNAINYSNFNWDTGVCASCNDPHIKTWKSIRNHFHVYPLYVPDGSFVKEKMFDWDDAFFDRNQSFGLNLKMTVKCDLTDFFITNKFAFKNLLATKVIWRLLTDMKFSQQINSIEENIKMMIIRDLEGDIETKLTNIPSQYNRELMSVAFDISGINGKCLECEDAQHAIQYGVI